MNGGEIQIDARHSYRAPIESVFDAWTDPALVAKWFVCGDVLASRVEIELRVGGSYLIHWDTTPRGPRTLRGIYREIDRPRRLAFTWKWDGLDEDTLVTMQFVSRGGGTEIVLSHTGFRSGASRGEHDYGWGCCFGSCGRLLE